MGGLLYLLGIKFAEPKIQREIAVALRTTDTTVDYLINNG
jgi:hypothetical protein